jgi:hypothetical protein
MTELSTTVTSLSFFDRLSSMTHSNGEIKKCLDDYVDGFLVSDLLRKNLLEKTIFSEKETREFIYCIFQFLCLGGSLCQFEDQLSVYLEFTKAFYKECVR